MFRFDGTRFALYPDAAREIERSTALANDLRSLGSGIPPSQDILSAAPYLDSYWFVLQPTVVCMGNAHGHPDSSRNPSLMHTSELVVDGRDLGWVRTRSRYYRVGQELRSPDEISLRYPGY